MSNTSKNENSSLKIDDSKSKILKNLKNEHKEDYEFIKREIISRFR